MSPEKGDTRRTTPQVNPSVVDRIQQARSVGRNFDGIWIGTWRGSHEDLAPVEHALRLLKQRAPLSFARVTRDLERIWVYLLPHGVGEYKSSINACLLDERYVADPSTSIEQIACTIVHEATHARLERCGIEYEEADRARIEAICFRRELAFAVRLPNSAQLQQDIARCLGWCKATPEYFDDRHFQARREAGISGALSYLGVPGWFYRAASMVALTIRRAKKALRM